MKRRLGGSKEQLKKVILLMANNYENKCKESDIAYNVISRISVISGQDYIHPQPELDKIRKICIEFFDKCMELGYKNTAIPLLEEEENDGE